MTKGSAMMSNGSQTSAYTDMKTGKEVKVKSTKNGAHIVGEEPAPQAIETSPLSPGTQPDYVYEASMAPWRYWIRKTLIQNLTEESRLIASMQDRVRTSYLDKYFVYTSVLGTHTFFMTGLPTLFWFGYRDVGYGLVFVLSLGCYFVSFLKDLICIPRPYVPPVTRLTMGSHHLEYGFPSTHSTNSVSIALLIFSYIRSQYLENTVSLSTYQSSCVILFVYAVSVVYGRLYTGMHSFTDCVCGVLLGTLVWFLYNVGGDYIVSRIVQSGLVVPCLSILMAAFVINRHPQPIDDCPCFEDAVAFVAVLLGLTVSKWFIAQFEGLEQAIDLSRMPGGSMETWGDVLTLLTFSALKMVVGILVLFTWRILAKSVFHMILPPFFRFLAQLFTLPHRRFYTPATDYTSVPSGKGLQPIPSVLDLPSQLAVDATGTSTAMGMQFDSRLHPYKGLRNLSGGAEGVGLKSRNSSGNNLSGTGKSREKHSDELEKNIGNGTFISSGIASSGIDEDTVRRYDVDVITKVIVYAGIGIFSGDIMPWMFKILGWGISI